MTSVAERLLLATVAAASHGEAPDEDVRIEVLARIAGGLCRDAAVTRVELAQDDGWSWNARTGVLSVGRRALRAYGVEACAGIIAHEVGHALLSRYHLVLGATDLAAAGAKRPVAGSPGDLAKVAWRCMNALEDPRVEAWMAQRYPGVRPWLQSAARHALEGWQGREPPALRAEQWALGACVDGSPEVPGSRELLARLLPDVRDSLARTRAARLHYRDGFLPPVDICAWAPLSPHAAETYDVLQRRFALEGSPGDAEKRARIEAVHACCFARTDILPELTALVEADVEEIAPAFAADPDLPRDLHNRDVVSADALVRAVRAGERPRATPTEHHRRLARFLITRASRPAPAVGRGATPLAPGARPTDGLGASLAAPSTSAASRPPLSDVPAEAPAPTARALVDSLERALTAGLRAARGARARSHAHAGLRPDLRRVMANEGAADPSRWRPAWHRAAPVRPDAAFALLIDCSGSMRDEKIAAATEAADVFAQALARVGAPYLVAGFQDVLFPLAPAGVSLARAREGIALARLEVAGARPGGNNQPQHNDDGPCLLRAAAELRALPAAQRVLVVLSDGAPSGSHSTAADLRAAVDRLTREGDIDLVGIGIGAGATHVAHFYPRHVVVDRVAALPAALVRVLRRTAACGAP